MTAGYSGTPLAAKLGIAAGTPVCPWVDVEVCAVDAVGSGLKLVVRRELRGPARR